MNKNNDAKDYKFNSYGYDIQGFHKDTGKNYDGFTRDSYKFNKDGYDIDGYDQYGYNINNRDRNGIRPFCGIKTLSHRSMLFITFLCALFVSFTFFGIMAALGEK